MNPYLAYRQPHPVAGRTRIDLLLALYDGAIDRLGRALDMLRAGNCQRAQALLARAQLIVMGLAAGVRPDVDVQLGANVLRLYEYVVHELAQKGAVHVENALRVLTTLREGFLGVRDEASELERTGQLPAAEDLGMVAAEA